MPHKQQLQQKLQHHILPKHIQLLSLLQAPNIQLDDNIKEELEKNIILEMEESSESSLDHTMSTHSIEHKPSSEYYESYQPHYFIPGIQDHRIINFSQAKTNEEYLLDQLPGLLLNDEEHFVAEFIIGSLDNKGFLTQSDQSIRDDLLLKYDIDMNESLFKRIVSRIQQLDPLGVATRTIQDYLILQLQTYHPKALIAMRIITQYYDLFVHKRYEDMMIKLQISHDVLQEAIDLIKKLQPFPFQTSIDNREQGEWKIYPDFLVLYEQGQFMIEMLKYKERPIKVNQYYVKLLEAYKRKEIKKDIEAYQYLTAKFQQANDFINNLHERDRVLKATISLIVSRQKKFFQTGVHTDIEPMILNDIAAPLHLDISTMSRIVNRKFVQTHFGIFNLKSLFGRTAVNNKGTILNVRLIKDYIKDMITLEDPRMPLSDEQIEKILSEEKHITISRRTVAKYRQSLQILSSDKRRQL